MMECGVPNLELQGLAPLHNSNEMAMDMIPQIELLNEDDDMRALAKAAYQRDSIDRRFANVPVLQKPIDAAALERVLLSLLDTQPALSAGASTA